MAQSRYITALGLERKDRTGLHKKKMKHRGKEQLSDVSELLEQKPFVDVDTRRQILRSMEQCREEASTDLDLAKTEMDDLLHEIDVVERKLDLFSDMVARRAEGLRLSALEREVKKTSKQLYSWNKHKGLNKANHMKNPNPSKKLPPLKPQDITTTSLNVTKGKGKITGHSACAETHNEDGKQKAPDYSDNRNKKHTKSKKMQEIKDIWRPF